MTINNPVAYVIAVVSAVLLVYLVGERLVFLAGAERTIGEVKAVSAARDRCGRYGQHACTQFTATVVFAAGGTDRVIFVHAGYASGYGRPITLATYRVGAPVMIAFSKRDPTRADRDTVVGIWGGPILVFMILLTALVKTISGPHHLEEDKTTTLFGGSGGMNH